MNRITIPAAEHIPAASQPLLAAVQQQLGMVPNLMKLLAHSPAALEGYLSLNGALAKGRLDAALRERIALAVAEFNGCDYCLSAHSYLAKHVAKLGDDEIAAARDFASADAKQAAALRFALNVAEQRGSVADAELATLRDAGFDEAETLEIVLTVALNILTNYVNNAAATAVDFPLVQSRG
ncbi:carboxymuconolactone decarboxylase family protein [Chromobacterium vaccinii]|uniref:carboxymuconolactone decarboxylase family protein n=1 Tax=Chromobacterium vaccinii TaxID=1108595 RepID=UPI000617B136|nr:carboxymuconolactone decarboxylase family protein [Chromobacterium vaccinii]